MNSDSPDGSLNEVFSQIPDPTAGSALPPPTCFRTRSILAMGRNILSGDGLREPWPRGWSQAAT